jgi:CBS domain-containing protein
MTPDQPSIVRAEDVMHRGVVTIDGMAPVREAIEKMRSQDVKALIVDKRNADDVWGIVVLGDIVRDVIAQGRSPDDVDVYEIMAKPVITVPPDMDIKYVARLLYRVGVGSAPVESGGKLLGMVSLSDLVLKQGISRA